MCYLSGINECGKCLVIKKKWLLLPVATLLLLLGALIVITEGSAIAPFIYAMF